MLKRFTFAAVTLGSTLSLVFTTASSVRADVSYQLDHGKSQTAFGIVDNNCQTASGFTWGDLLWLNSFAAQPGGEVIDSISVGWGTPQPISPRSTNCTSMQTITDSGLSSAAGQIGKVLLFSDPNNDGNPDDAQLLAIVDAVINAPGHDTTGQDLLTTIAIPETLVNGNFFIGALFPNQQEGQFPAALDNSAPVKGRSWAGYRLNPPFGQADAPPLTDLVNTPLVLTDNFQTGVDENGQTIFGGNWLLRANGTTPQVRKVPEGDLAIGLLAIGGLGLASRLKRRR